MHPVVPVALKVMTKNIQHKRNWMQGNMLKVTAVV